MNTQDARQEQGRSADTSDPGPRPTRCSAPRPERLVDQSTIYDGWMRDSDMRAALRNHVNSASSGPQGGRRIIDELGINGEVRVDVTVLDGVATGYELKSPRDSLKRLPKQVEWYSKVFDRAVVVVTERHLLAAMEIVPPWWGCVVAEPASGWRVLLDERRPAGKNPGIDPQFLAMLLWRPEALRALEERGLDRGYRSKPRSVLATRLAESVPVDELRNLVWGTLKSREGWRETQPSA